MGVLPVPQIENTRRLVWRKTVLWTVRGPLGAGGLIARPPVDLAIEHAAGLALHLHLKMGVCPAMDLLTKPQNARSAWQGCVRLWTGVGPFGPLGLLALHRVDQGRGRERGLAPGGSSRFNHL